jgi:peptidoglycan/LPS O-acetylase OafA/YrhL
VLAWPLVWYLGRRSGHVVLPFVIVVLYLAAFRGRICSAIFSNRVITGIGGVCYSIYLFHALVVYAVKHQTWPLHMGQNFWVYLTLQTLLITPWILLFCGSFFLLIERPCMDGEWPRKLWRAFQLRLAPQGPQSPAGLPVSMETSEISGSSKAS